MAKFNTTNTIKTENHSGYAAYSMSKKEQLMTAVVTTMFGEEKYYSSWTLEDRHLSKGSQCSTEYLYLWHEAPDCTADYGDDFKWRNCEGL